MGALETTSERQSKDSNQGEMIMGKWFTVEIQFNVGIDGNLVVDPKEVGAKIDGVKACCSS